MFALQYFARASAAQKIFCKKIVKTLDVFSAVMVTYFRFPLSAGAEKQREWHGKIRQDFMMAARHRLSRVLGHGVGGCRSLPSALPYLPALGFAPRERGA